MATTERSQFARSLRIGFLIAAIVGVVTGLFAWHQVNGERQIDLEDVNNRAHVLAQQLSVTVEKALALPENEKARKALRPRLEGYRRLLGYAVFHSDGRLVAAGKTVAEFSGRLEPVVRRAIQSGAETIEKMRFQGTPLHVLAVPIKKPDQSAGGVLVVVQDISFIDERATERLVQYGFWIVIVTLLVVTLVVGATWFIYERPLRKLTDWMRRLRTENVSESPPPGLPSALLRSESDRLAASFRAARSTGKRLSLAALHEEQVWTSDRLRAHVVAALGEGQQMIVMSNREPYMHQLHDGKPKVIVPAGGLVTALDPILQACGGVWIAHGSGDADRKAADEGGQLTVPPYDPHYTLKRIWLTRDEEQGYYYGFSNEGLWPLCHLVHERPVFRATDWECYRRVNQRFADALLEEIGGGTAVVLVQDYQLALVPQMIKSKRPDLQIGLFWHIPWPNPEAFRICPWSPEILAGMLGADLVGFHLQQYCNNFLDTVDRVIESRLDWDHFAVELKGHVSHVRPFPISIQDWSERKLPMRDELARQIAALKSQYKLDGQYVAVGVDRIDYTKGLLERFRAIAAFLEKNRQYLGRFTFVELGAPSRMHIQRYSEHLSEIEALADEVNWKYQMDGWKPIRLLVAHHDANSVHAFLSMASMCIVSSLHDGMNLVAKEYVAAQESGEGVLILSEFTGAARELSDALIINPYDTEQFAEAIRYGIVMDPTERRRRMERMHRFVEEHNVYRWAAGFLSELAATRSTNKK